MRCLCTSLSRTPGGCVIGCCVCFSLANKGPKHMQITASSVVPFPSSMKHATCPSTASHTHTHLCSVLTGGAGSRRWSTRLSMHPAVPHQLTNNSPHRSSRTHKDSRLHKTTRKDNSSKRIHKSSSNRNHSSSSSRAVKAMPDCVWCCPLDRPLPLHCWCR